MGVKFVHYKVKCLTLQIIDTFVCLHNEIKQNIIMDPSGALRFTAVYPSVRAFK